MNRQTKQMIFRITSLVLAVFGVYYIVRMGMSLFSCSAEEFQSTYSKIVKVFIVANGTSLILAAIRRHMIFGKISKLEISEMKQKALAEEYSNEISVK